MKIQENYAVPYTQDRYLSCNQNKAELIKFISNYLRNPDTEVINCPGDVDSTVALTEMKFAIIESEPVLIVADDTDFGDASICTCKILYGGNVEGT